MVWAPPAEFAPQSCGFVMAASGRKFATLAEQAARSLQQSNPGFEVDLWTDVTVDESLFAQVHPLEKSWFRPKFEAIVKSRFERTLYLDCDLVVIADLSDVFWLLDKMDIAGIHAPVRNAGHATSVWRMALPNSFPQINGGVMAVKRSDAAIRLFEDCQRALIEDALPRDQLVIRELLWLSDLRLGILPPEYNLRDAKLALVNGSSVSAPRILHNSRFSRDMRDDTRAPTPEDIYGRFFLDHVDDLLRADRQLSPGTKTVVRPLPERGWRTWWRLWRGGLSR